VPSRLNLPRTSAQNRRGPSLPEAAGRLALAAATVAVVVGPICAFARILHAEGPLAVLVSWAGFVALAIHVSANAGEKSPRGIAVGAGVAAAIAGSLGSLATLAQLAAANRSLAEAWLTLAREGYAFGFFSYFAAELYALFLIAQAILFARRRWIEFGLAFSASLALIAGVVSGKQILLAIALIFAACFFAAVGESRHRARRFRSASAPAAAAIILSLVFARVPALNPLARVSPPNFGSLIARVAPSFPLLRDVPGYGIGEDAESMPRAVYRSSRAVFEARGEPYSVHYLEAARYRDWNGVAWVRDTNPGIPVTVTRLRTGESRPTRTLRLTLTDDFSPTLPLERDTGEVAVAPGAPLGVTANLGFGARFEPSARRGFFADFVRGPVSESAPTGGARADYLGGASEKSARIDSLAAELRASTEGDAAFVNATLDYLTEGYTYSLTANSPGGTDAIEYFIFTGKKGFCLYFASAFIAIARAGGIPARLCEGYRVTLDEYGIGRITGNNAHAWPEVLVDGEWKAVEPTPPYREGNPFARAGKRDIATQRQLAAIFGKDQNAPEKSAEKRSLDGLVASARNRAIAAIAAVSAAIAAMALLCVPRSAAAAARGDARKLVRKYARSGVESPEKIGWVEWAQKSARAAENDSAANAARLAAERMIRLTFAPAQADKLASRRRPHRKMGRRRR